MTQPKQVAILVDELELIDLQMGLSKLYQYWSETVVQAQRNQCSEGYIVTCNQVMNSISELETKLTAIKEEQF